MRSALPPQTPPTRILIAEDNPVNRKVLGAILSRMGYAFDAVENGRLAVEARRSHRYALILMDVQMPEMDGLEATRTIRRWEQQHGDHPVVIVAVTANSTPADRYAGCAAGMDDYLAKPVDLKLLREILADWLSAGPPPEPFKHSRRQVEADLS